MQSYLKKIFEDKKAGKSIKLDVNSGFYISKYGNTLAMTDEHGNPYYTMRFDIMTLPKYNDNIPEDIIRCTIAVKELGYSLQYKSPIKDRTCNVSNNIFDTFYQMIKEY